jgi:hypothetical protein
MFTRKFVCLPLHKSLILSTDLELLCNVENLNTIQTNTTVSQPVVRSVVANDKLHYGLIHHRSQGTARPKN